MAFVLKLLSGPHMGAEILLEDGSYSMGTDESCDFVLCDAAVAPRHCTLEIQNGNLRIQGLDGELWYADSVHPSGVPLEPHPGELLRAGTTYFSLFPEGTPWREVALPDLVGTNLDRKVPAGSADEPAGASTDRPEEPTVAAGASARESSAGLLPGKEKRIKWVPVVLVAVSVALLWAGHTLWKHEPSTDSPPHPACTEELVKNTLERMGEKDLRITPLGTGFVITGSPRDRSTIQGISRELASSGCSFRLQIPTWEDMKRDLLEMLEGLETSGSLSVEAASEEGLVVRGVLASEQELKRVQQIVQDDLPGGRFVRWRVVTLDEAARYLEKLLAPHVKELDVRVKVLTNHLQAQGTADRRYQPVWDQVRGLFEKRFGNSILESRLVWVHPTASDNTPAPEEAGTPPVPKLDIQAVVLAQPAHRSYIVTESGRKIAQGESVNEDYALQSITEHKLVLKGRQGATVELPLNRPPIILRYSW